MKILTSIAPNHKNIDSQCDAISSWLNLGFKVYSFNPQEEIDLISSKYLEVTFIPVIDLALQVSGKKYIKINSILDWAKTQESGVFSIINSDIIIDSPKELMSQYLDKAKESIVIGQRIDYTNNIDEARVAGKVFIQGFDLFMIHSKFLSIYPKTNYSIGNTHWDYWVPYTAVKAEVPLVKIGHKILFHKIHTTQWHSRVWFDMGVYMRSQENLVSYPETLKGIADMSEMIKHTILNKATTI